MGLSARVRAARFLSAYAQGQRSFYHWDLQGVDLRAECLPDIDLRGARLRGANLRGTQLPNAVLAVLICVMQISPRPICRMLCWHMRNSRRQSCMQRAWQAQISPVHSLFAAIYAALILNGRMRPRWILREHA